MSTPPLSIKVGSIWPQPESSLTPLFYRFYIHCCRTNKWSIRKFCILNSFFLHFKFFWKPKLNTALSCRATNPNTSTHNFTDIERQRQWVKQETCDMRKTSSLRLPVFFYNSNQRTLWHAMSSQSQALIPLFSFSTFLLHTHSKYSKHYHCWIYEVPHRVSQRGHPFVYLSVSSEE